MRELALDDVEALAVGAWILGTGGGGSPYLGLLNMRRLYAEGHRVSLMSPLDLADENGWRWSPIWGRRWSARSGSPTAATSRAVEIQQGLLGSQLRAVMPLEIGGGAEPPTSSPPVSQISASRRLAEAVAAGSAFASIATVPLVRLAGRSARSTNDQFRHSPLIIRAGS
jgi:DUF917 family protein